MAPIKVFTVLSQWTEMKCSIIVYNINSKFAKRVYCFNVGQWGNRSSVRCDVYETDGEKIEVKIYSKSKGGILEDGC